MNDGPASAKFIIVCEGNADRVFITRLIQSRWGSVPDVAVRCTHAGDDRCAGRNGLTPTLLALDAARSTITDAVKGIAIVFDSDDDPSKSFKEIIESIRAAKLSYPLPSNPLEVKAGSSYPAIGIALIPWHDRPGHL